MKTVTFDDEAYELLRSAKLAPNESFSKVVKRVLGQRKDWDASAGGWADVTDEEVAAIRQRGIDAFGWTGDKKW